MFRLTSPSISSNNPAQHLYRFSLLQVINIFVKHTNSFNIQFLVMNTQTESQIKHHPDDWSFSSGHHHHVERTVHPVIVELIEWVRIWQASVKSLIPLYLDMNSEKARPF